MTREEAIKNLEMIRVAFVEPVTKEQRKLIDDTFDVAIKALKQDIDFDKQTKKAIKEIVASMWFRHDEDIIKMRLIDADEALKRIADKSKKSDNLDVINGLCGATAIIYDMLIESGQESEDKKC